MSERLLVLDTNVVLDVLHFDDPVARPLRQALDAGRVRAVANESTFGEWQRVLAYPGFGLSAARRAELSARYRLVCAFQGPLSVTDVLPKGTPIHYGLKPVWSRMPHKGTPIHYGLKPVWSRMPRCTDPDDQKFLDLAAQLRVPLISKDRAVLRLRRRCAPLFSILTPAEAAAWLA